MNNQIEFNYETYLEGKHKLVTRGGIEIDKVRERKSDPYCYEYTLNGSWLTITSIGEFRVGLEHEYDLFMIPIQADETIPFDLGCQKEKLKECFIPAPVQTSDTPRGVKAFSETIDFFNVITSGNGSNLLPENCH